VAAIAVPPPPPAADCRHSIYLLADDGVWTCARCGTRGRVSTPPLNLAVQLELAAAEA
jgi:hypothetical protein